MTFQMFIQKATKLLSRKFDSFLGRIFKLSGYMAIIPNHWFYKNLKKLKVQMQDSKYTSGGGGE